MREMVKTYYLDRVCSRCGRPIWDTHKTGICPECWKAIDQETKARVRPGGESQAHQALKLIAQRFLSHQGCIEIKEEQRLRVNSNRVTVDMLGKTKGGELIAVECGGSGAKKLKKLKAMVSVIYILPYNSESPYLWSENMRICQNCGHIISVLP